MRKCNIENCESKHLAKGYCRKHYIRIRRNGTPDKKARIYICNSPYKNYHLMQENRSRKLTGTPLCAKCGKRATLIHHVDLSKDTHDIGNLMSLCPKCHNKPGFHNNNKYVDWFGVGLSKLAECFGLAPNTIWVKIKKGVSLDKTVRKKTSSKYSKLFGATLRELGDCFGLSRQTILNRIRNGVPLDKPKQQHYS